MTSVIRWLHISDLHADFQKTGWESDDITTALIGSAKDLRKKEGLQPDFIFFTGDLAFGHRGDSAGASIWDQFTQGFTFLDAVRNAFDPPIEKRNVFLVPGNHDVNISQISECDSDWLSAATRRLDDVQRKIQDKTHEWKQFLVRLAHYRDALKAQQYDNWLDDPDRLIYSTAREVAGLRVGICGFNSTWSSRGRGAEEKGKLWACLDFQSGDLRQRIKDSDFSVALVHHPRSWLVAAEGGGVDHMLRDFQFVLHGHEHVDWVRQDADTGHIMLSGAACYAHPKSENIGFSITELEPGAGKITVWLQRYDRDARTCQQRVLANRTDAKGRWIAKPTAWIDRFKANTDAKSPEPRETARTQDQAESVDRSNTFEQRYLQQMAAEWGRMELFGIDLPDEAREYSLSVAYVSLNLCTDEDELRRDSGVRVTESTKRRKSSRAQDESDQAGNSRSVESVLANLKPRAGRLLIRGDAGSGKTTLLRWIVTQTTSVDCESRTNAAAHAAFERTIGSFKGGAGPMSSGRLDWLSSDPFAPQPDWRSRLPILIRLRDCKGGSLPSPSQFAQFIPRNLPDPPANWFGENMRSGRAIIMFDGVDEVKKENRESIAHAIRKLVERFPDNYYIVTTRPGAMARKWADGLGFLELRIDPLSPSDREQLIDKWHEAMEAQLRAAQRPRSLAELSTSLKATIAALPEIARLSATPLLCAAVCALHCYTNKRLPNSQVELLNELCELLVDRRDRLRPGLLQDEHLPSSYAGLSYEQKKDLLSEVAERLVRDGIPTMSALKFERCVKKVTSSFPGMVIGRTKDVADALIERSGLLRRTRIDDVEFIHSTFKDYLAAGRFVASNDVTSLLERAVDPAWQPVIVFSVSLPSGGDRFAKNLVKRLLASLPPSQRSKRRSPKATRIVARQKEYLLFRCKPVAYRLPKSLQDEIDARARALLPPRTLTDAEALALCGEAVVPYLRPKANTPAFVRAACARGLRLVGGKEADRILEQLRDDSSWAVLEELSTAFDPLTFRMVRQFLVSTGRFPHAIPRSRINDLRALKGITGVTSLDLRGTAVRDFSPLSSLTELERLDLRGTSISDAAPLQALSALKKLSLAQTRIEDIKPIERLAKLESLTLEYSQVSDLRPLAALRSLASLDLSGTLVTDIQPLSNLFRLRSLLLAVTKVADISALGQLRELKELVLLRTRVTNIECLKSMTKLDYVDLESTPVKDLSPLATTRLNRLDIANTSRNEIGDLALLKGIKRIRLAGNPITDVSPLEGLTGLEELDLSGTNVEDISPLRNLKALSSLDLTGTPIRDFGPLEALTALERLELSRTRFEDVRCLSKLVKLERVNLAGTRVKNTSGLEHLPVLQSVNLIETSARMNLRLQAKLLR